MLLLSLPKALDVSCTSNSLSTFSSTLSVLGLLTLLFWMLLRSVGHNSQTAARERAIYHKRIKRFYSASGAEPEVVIVEPSIHNKRDSDPQQNGDGWWDQGPAKAHKAWIITAWRQDSPHRGINLWIGWFFVFISFGRAGCVWRRDVAKSV